LDAARARLVAFLGFGSFIESSRRFLRTVFALDAMAEGSTGMASASPRARRP
jgi:hypothetical protein